MNKSIEIKKSNEQITHTTITTFFSIENHMRKFGDCIKIHTSKKDGGEMIHNGIVKKIQNLINKDSLIENLLLHLSNKKQTEDINILINKIKEF